MPLKHVPRERAWGTRYDTLGKSPPSPPSSPPTQRSATVDANRTTKPTSSQHLEQGAVGKPSATGQTVTQEGTPHDASIFVGSLPSNVDHGELTQRLSEHLAVYSQIKAIKVVRDSRGGICAFVQCDSPSSAGDLLQSLRANPPRPFLGRFLRFEPAKAFRTLLISYRVPSNPVPLNADGISADADDPSLHLAHAMRIFRSQNSKYLGLLYDEDALNHEAETAVEGAENCPHRDKFNGGGVLLHPLTYDTDNMRKLAMAFGPLDSFREYPVSTEANGRPYPYPHDALRSSEMAKGVWEVKWQNREDSVVALITLRRIPYLSVSWAHHPPLAAIQSPGLQKLINGSLPPGLWSRNYSRGQGNNHNAQDLIRQLPASPAPRAHLFSALSPAVEGLHNPASPDVQIGNASPASTLWADQTNELESRGTSPSLPQDVPPPPKISLPAASSLQKVPVTPKVDSSYPETPCSAMSRFSIAGTCGSPVNQLGTRDDHASLTRTPRGDNTNQFTISPSSGEWTRDIDPTTVFVGGLESLPGDGETDDIKLRRIFGRFGTIDNVQIVRPMNRRSTFAFVKFSNADSAARAVQEEHNQMYDGRPLRVQFRDRNPAPRGAWRSGRGRGRNLFGGPCFERYLPFGSPLGVGVGGLRTTSSPSAGPSPLRSGCELDPMNGCTDRLLHAHSLRDMADADASKSSVSSGTTKVPSLHQDVSHGATSTVASSTPPPSSSSASATTSSAIPITPYHMNVGFFPPQPWVPPYTASYPYAVPLVPGYGYSGYPYPPIPPMPPAFIAREPPPGAAHNVPGSAWTTSDNACTTELGASDTRPSDIPLQPALQPPLRATGFIQNEHGTFIPVYQREALDQYMANAHGRPPVVQSKTPPQTSVVLTPSCSTPWKPAPPGLSAYYGGYPLSVQAVGPSMPPPPSSFSPIGHQPLWMPGSIPYGVAGFHPPNHTVANPLATSPGGSLGIHRAAYTPSSQSHIARRSTSLNRFSRDHRYAPTAHNSYGMARREGHSSPM